MLTSRRIAGVLFAAVVMMLSVPRFASGQDADTQEVLRYTLTDSGLAKYVQATRQLAALPGGMPGNCDDDEDTESASLDEVVARVDAMPGAKAAIQSAGMSTREYMLFSLSLLHNGMAAWATSQPGGTLPPGVSKANVDFVNRHEAELKQLQGLSKQGDCGDDTADEEGEE
jgi:hypothetical protein